MLYYLHTSRCSDIVPLDNNEDDALYILTFPIIQMNINNLRYETHLDKSFQFIIYIDLLIQLFVADSVSSLVN